MANPIGLAQYRALTRLTKPISLRPYLFRITFPGVSKT